MFLHAGDAAHSDLGMLCSEDAVLAITKLGESSELLSSFITADIEGAQTVSLVYYTGGGNVFKKV
jgi:arabinose-5-phosphate isomerase